MADLIILAVVVLLLGCELGYIRKTRRKGVQCIGCPHCSSCGGQSCRSGERENR